VGSGAPLCLPEQQRIALSPPKMLPELREKAAVQESAEVRARGPPILESATSHTSLACIQRIDLSKMDED